MFFKKSRFYSLHFEIAKLNTINKSICKQQLQAYWRIESPCWRSSFSIHGPPKSVNGCYIEFHIEYLVLNCQMFSKKKKMFCISILLVLCNLLVLHIVDIDLYALARHFWLSKFELKTYTNAPIFSQIQLRPKALFLKHIILGELTEGNQRMQAEDILITKRQCKGIKMAEKKWVKNNITFKTKYFGSLMCFFGGNVRDFSFSQVYFLNLFL